MKIDAKVPPREFEVGISGIVLSHCADVELAPDELVTFVSPTGAEYDVTRKSWGYYATPSLTGRLAANGFRAALVRNVDTKHYYIVLIDESKINEWYEYNRIEQQEIVMWLNSETLSTIPTVETAGPT